MCIFWLEPESQHSEAASPKCPVCWAHICVHFALVMDSLPALTHRKAHLASFETNNKGMILDKGDIILPSCRKEQNTSLRDYPKPCVLLGDREMWTQQVKSWWKSWTALHRLLDSLRWTTHNSLCNFLLYIFWWKKLLYQLKILEFLLYHQHTAKNTNMNLPITSRSLRKFSWEITLQQQSVWNVFAFLPAEQQEQCCVITRLFSLGRGLPS